MEKLVLCAFVIFIAAVGASPPKVTKQYRSDYVYNKKTDAFYKLHTETRQGWQAMKICEVEGSKLMEPTTQEDVEQLMEMLGRYPHLEQIVWIDQNSTQNTSGEYDLTWTAATPEDWQGMLCYARSIWLNTFDKPCSERLPFICKVEAKDAPYDERCGTYGTPYRHVPSVGSCYKIPRVAKTWNVAYADCRAEGGHLLVLNSERERQVVKDITYREPWVLGSGNRNYLLAGFREIPTGSGAREFITIYNQTFEEAGFGEWEPGEPNLRNEQCGCVYENDAKLADVGCEAFSAYVCEKEIPTHTDPIPSTNDTVPSSTDPVPSPTDTIPSTTDPIPSTTDPIPSTTVQPVTIPTPQESNTTGHLKSYRYTQTEIKADFY